jgi:hypothetical protein
MAARHVLAASGCGPMRRRAWVAGLSPRHMGDVPQDDGDPTSVTVPPTLCNGGARVYVPLRIRVKLSTTELA